MKQWMTLEEAASHLKRSRSSLYQLAQKKKIPAVKLGRSWRFDREAVDNWLSQSRPISETEFPWQDCLDRLLEGLRKRFGKRFASLWIYGSWARGDQRADSDVDLLIVLHPIENREHDSNTVFELAYEATFGRDRPVLFSTIVISQKDFLEGMEPLLLNIRKEGKKVA
ncbi:MAG: helix-turn-helix domain-containing protein [Deltaproteobacteria bacterium]|nr:helix-turn-helix domain-containing protein [Deltaproteobacteria bacterium]